MMNTKLLKNNNMFKNLYTNKRLFFLVLSIILASAIILGLSFVLFTAEETDETPKKTMITGTVFIDGTPAPAGVNVSFIFKHDMIWDQNGTDEIGSYEINVTGFTNESFMVYITYNGQSFMGADQQGNLINRTLTNNATHKVDIYIFTVTEEDDDSEDNSSGGDTNDDSEDDTTDTDDNEDSDEGGDSGDNSGGGSNNGGGGSNNNDDSSDDETSGDDTTEDSDDDVEYIYLKVDKTIWNHTDQTWIQEQSAEIKETTKFNITISYNGSNLSEIHVIDQIPQGLKYLGNATVNGNKSKPIIDDTNHTLQWNLPAVSDQNKTIFIQYNTSVLTRETQHNDVSVHLIKNDTSTHEKQATATVFVYGDLTVSKMVKNETQSDWYTQTSSPIGTPLRFNISVFYNGSHSVSHIQIKDNLTDGFTYIGNASINNIPTEPWLTNNNQTLIWNISTLPSGETLYIEFDANITKNTTLQNTVSVQAVESLGKQFDTEAIAIVTGRAPLQFACTKTVRSGNSSYNDTIHAFVGETAQFNVTITNLQMNTVYNLAVFDCIPDSLTYINGSAKILFENNTYYKEPEYNNETNTYYWININEVIAGYFNPNDTLTILYNVSIEEEGISTNIAKVKSSLCGTCDPLTGRDSAHINATMPISELSVDIVIPDQTYIDQFVPIKARANGGQPPYQYAWDVDNDTLYDDENTSSFITSWSTEGLYPISVKVTDNTSNIITKTVIVNVTIEPLSVSIGGPYTSEPGDSITFDGSATGGLGNYTWFWDFGDGNNSTLQQPTHLYSIEGTYIVTVNVTDERNISAIDTTTVTILNPDSTPPTITYHSPINAIYLKNRPVIPFFRIVVFGSLDINITAEDNESTITSIELYINEHFIKRETGNTLQYTWDERVFGRQTITIKATNSADIQEIHEKMLWKFF